MSGLADYKNLQGCWSSHYPIGSGLMGMYVFLPENKYHYMTLLQQDNQNQYNGHHGVFEIVEGQVIIQQSHDFYWDSPCVETANGCFPAVDANLELRPISSEKIEIGNLFSLDTYSMPMTLKLIPIKESDFELYSKICSDPDTDDSVSYFLKIRELLLDA